MSFVFAPPKCLTTTSFFFHEIISNISGLLHWIPEYSSYREFIFSEYFVSFFIRSCAMVTIIFIYLYRPFTCIHLLVGYPFPLYQLVFHIVWVEVLSRSFKLDALAVFFRYLKLSLFTVFVDLWGLPLFSGL